ncbi:MAG: radical SAM protein [Acetobacteraceae bacterium]|nr:radical SAM protein [Acetobacteraceae bacterium]
MPDLLDVRFSVNSRENAYRRIQDEMFIRGLNPRAPSRYHVLDGFGAAVFEFVEEKPRAAGEVVAHARKLKGDGGAELEADVLDFLYHMVRLGLFNSPDRDLILDKLSPRPAPGGEPPAADGEAEAFDACNYMYGRAYELMLPFKVDIEVTYACNLRCRHCYAAHEPPKHLATSEVVSLLDQLAELGCLELVFTGGEMFLRPDMLDLIAHARRLNFAVTLLTNATLITPDIASGLAELMPEHVSASIYGGRPETHDAFTGVEGSLERTVTGARLCAERGLRVLNTYVLTNENCHERHLVRRLMADNGLDYKSTVLLFPRTDMDPSPMDYRLTDEQLREVMLDGSFTPIRTRCNSGRSRFRVAPDGTVHPCELMRLTLGSLRRLDFRTILETSTLLKDLRQKDFNNPPECAECEKWRNCPRCSGVAFLETGDPMRRWPEGCRIATIYASIPEPQRPRRR